MEPEADETAPRPVMSNRRTRTAGIVMIVGLVVLAVSALLFLLPVVNPGVQDCGSPAVFLLHAKGDRPLVDSGGDPINGWGKARLARADAHRCSRQVARRAIPAGGLLVGFWVLVPVAAMIGWSGRRAFRKTTVD
ncbi:MAG: hypothetical protein JST73_06530 [Actinobacteria bacterium]|nr:hypothetical protein [Actinomycetota bacterium]